MRVKQSSHSERKEGESERKRRGNPYSGIHICGRRVGVAVRGEGATDGGSTRRTL